MVKLRWADNQLKKWCLPSLSFNTLVPAGQKWLRLLVEQLLEPIQFWQVSVNFAVECWALKENYFPTCKSSEVV